MVVIRRIRHAYQPPKHGRGPEILVADAYSNNPIKSPIDGSIIDGRQALRDHNERHDVVDIGDDPIGYQPSAPTNRGGEGLRADLEETYGELSTASPDHAKRRAD